MRIFKTLFLLVALAGTASLHAKAASTFVATQPMAAAIPAASAAPYLGTVEKLLVTTDKDQVITSMKVVVRLDGGTTGELTVDHPTSDQLVPVGTRVQLSALRNGFYVLQ